MTKGMIITKIGLYRNVEDIENKVFLLKTDYIRYL